jgi:MFS family permease
MIRRHGLFLLSCFRAFTAGHMFNYTVILYLQEAVGSDVLSGLGFGLAFGSSIVFGWFGGVLCDRVPPGRVIHGAQAMFLAGLACLWWADVGAGAEQRAAWALTGAFAGGLAWSFVGPARLTTLGQIASATELRPLTIVFNLQVLVGFGLAPLLIGLIRSRTGWVAVIAVAALGFVLSSALLLGLKTSSHRVPAPRSVWSDIAEGFRTVGSAPLLRQLMLAAVIAYALTGPMQILLPKLARQELGLSEAQRGAYLGLMAMCLIAGGVLALVLVRRLHHGGAIFGGTALGGAFFALLAYFQSALPSALALACVGVLGGMVVSLVVSGIQAEAPQAVRGRVMSMYAITSQVVPALSGLLAGVLVDRVGVQDAITAAGLALAAIAVLAALSMPVLRRHAGVDTRVTA